MKKGLLVVVAGLLLVAAPALLFAQGLLPAGTPGLFGPAFGAGPYGQSPYGSRFFDPLSLYVGWGDTTPGEVTFALDDQLGPAREIAQRWNVRGIWLGVAEKANFSPNSAVAVEAWWLIPITVQGSSSASVTLFVPQLRDFVTFKTGLNWDVRPDWWFIDGRLLVTPYPSNSMMFAGFRYDHFSTRFESPSGGLGILAGTTDVTVNSYIPYVGGEYKARASGGGNILVRVLGFPWVPAQVERNMTIGGGQRAEARGNFSDRGYFFEIFGEYDWNVADGAGIGAFARWNVLQGRGVANTDVDLVGRSVSHDVSFYRNHATVGGKVTLDFALPF